jgi:hypothetical protein
VEGEYHRNPHRGLEGETPADRWAAHSEDVRFPPDDLSELFLFEQKRRVQADRTVALDGIAYEVDATLVGETVVLRYDPSRPREQRAVQIWHRGKRVQLARRVDVYANCFVKRDHATKALQPSNPAQQPQNSLRMSDFDGSQGNVADNDKEVF